MKIMMMREYKDRSYDYDNDGEREEKVKDDDYEDGDDDDDNNGAADDDGYDDDGNDKRNNCHNFKITKNSNHKFFGSFDDEKWIHLYSSFHN